MKIRTFPMRSNTTRVWRFQWAVKGGGPVLKSESKWWRHLSGIVINHGSRHTVIMWRNWEGVI